MEQLIALDPISHGPYSVKRGERFEATPSDAKRLIARGSAKKARPVENKMQPAPENKAQPFQGAGEEEPSSASPADPASPQTTASESGTGARRRRRKVAEESS